MLTNLIFSKKTANTGSLQLQCLQRAESKHTWVVLSRGLGTQGTAVRDRASEATEEGNPYKEVLPLWEGQVVQSQGSI